MKETILHKYILLIIIIEGLKINNIITQTLLVAILMHCNFDLFQKEFTETHRKNNINETNNNLMERHSNFYWVGRKL